MALTVKLEVMPQRTSPPPSPRVPRCQPVLVPVMLRVPLVEVMEVGVRSSTRPRFMPVMPRSAPACGAKLCMARDAGAQVS